MPERDTTHRHTQMIYPAKYLQKLLTIIEKINKYYNDKLQTDSLNTLV